MKNIKSNINIISAMGASLACLVIGLALGLTLNERPATAAEDTCKLNQEQVTKIYEAIFHRPPDDQAMNYVDHDLSFVLEEFKNSREHSMYSGLFKATKALENARRQEGNLSENEENDYKDIIDSALSHINNWSKELPEQAEGAIGPEQAKQAIQQARENMSETAKEASNYGLMNALRNIGPPSDLPKPEENESDTDSSSEGNNADLSCPSCNLQS